MIKGYENTSFGENAMHVLGKNEVNIATYNKARKMKSRYKNFKKIGHIEGECRNPQHVI